MSDGGAATIRTTAVHGRATSVLRIEVAGGRRRSATIFGTEVCSRAGASVILRTVRAGRAIVMRHVAPGGPTVVLRSTAARGPSRSTMIFGTEVPSRAGATAILLTMRALRAVVMRHIARRPTLRAAATCGDNSMARELVRAGSSRDRRPTVIHRLSQVPVGRCKMLMIPLHPGRLKVTLVLCTQLVCGRTNMQTTGTAVEAHTVDRDIVDNRPVVYVRDVNRADVTDRSVIKESPTAPVAARESNTGIPEAVIDTAIESDVRTPIAGVP